MLLGRKALMDPAGTPSPERRALILRVEIESIGEQLARLLVKDAQEVPLAEDDERAAQLTAAESQLEEQRCRLQEEAERLDRLARDLADREAEAGGLTAAQRIRIAHSSWQAHETQRVLHPEDEVDAAHEADVFIREERLEQRETELAVLEQQLRRKETELMVYVADLQEEIVRREASSGWDSIAAALGG